MLEIGHAAHFVGRYGAFAATGNLEHWTANPYVYDQVARAVLRIPERRRPPGEIVPPAREKLVDAVGEDIEKARERLERWHGQLGEAVADQVVAEVDGAMRGTIFAGPAEKIRKLRSEQRKAKP